MRPASGPSLSKICRALAMAKMTPCIAGVSIIWEVTRKGKTRMITTSSEYQTGQPLYCIKRSAKIYKMAKYKCVLYIMEAFTYHSVFQ